MMPGRWTVPLICGLLPLEPPSFVQRLQDMSCMVGSEISMKCMLSGSLPMTVRWTKDDHELTEDEHIKMSYETNTAEMNLTNAHLSHSGKYVCEAQNRAGTQRCATVLTVTGLSDVCSLFVVDVSCRDSVTVRAGQIISLITRVKGRPDPEITWTKDARALSRDKRTEFNNNYPVCELVINDTVRSDYGKYAIAAKNSSGQNGDTSTSCIKPFVWHITYFINKFFDSLSLDWISNFNLKIQL
uniref:Ig-like domain-containing protein n=1 Tax=Kryptolebias marmoratus TaxID=37003 RepID=A0A3Q3B5S3_KRYMA